MRGERGLTGGGTGGTGTDDANSLANSEICHFNAKKPGLQPKNKPEFWF